MTAAERLAHAAAAFSPRAADLHDRAQWDGRKRRVSTIEGFAVILEILHKVWHSEVGVGRISNQAHKVQCECRWLRGMHFLGRVTSAVMEVAEESNPDLPCAARLAIHSSLQHRSSLPNIITFTVDKSRCSADRTLEPAAVNCRKIVPTKRRRQIGCISASASIASHQARSPDLLHLHAPPTLPRSQRPPLTRRGVSRGPSTPHRVSSTHSDTATNN